MVSTILIVCSPDDVPRLFGYYHLKRFAYLAAQSGHHLIFLRTATLDNFEKVVAQYDPELVIVNGHGGKLGVTGQDDNVILGVRGNDPLLGLTIHDENPELMTGRAVFLLTCNCGLELGPRLVDYGARAVAAFTAPFIFVSDGDDPTRESRGAAYFNAALQLPIRYINGYSWGESFEYMRKAFGDEARKAEERGDEEAAKYLYYDLVKAVAFGDLDARYMAVVGGVRDVYEFPWRRL